MDDSQALVLAQELADLATIVSQILNDLTLPLSDAQTQALQNYGRQLTDLSRRIATAGALAALAAAQPDFNAMTQATTAANAAASQLKSNAAKMNAILGILDKAVSFGTSLLAGPLGPAMTATRALAGAAASARS